MISKASDGRSFIGIGNGKARLATAAEIISAKGYEFSESSLGEIVRDAALMKDLGANGFTYEKLKEGIRLQKDATELQNMRLQNRNLEADINMKYINGVIGLVKSINEVITGFLQFKLASKQMEIMDRQQTLREDAERHAFQLQRDVMDREYAYRDAVLKNQAEIAELSAGVEIQKARIAADVKKSRDRSEALRDIFQRGRYSLGEPRYWA